MQTHILGAGGSGLGNATYRVSPANTTLVKGTDYGVAMSLAGTTATLPASPTQGDSYEVADISGGNVTVDGNGSTIYGSGGTSETLVDGQTNLYRWLDATYAGGNITAVNAGAVPYTLAIGALVVENVDTGKRYVNTAAITIPANDTLTGIAVVAQLAGTASNAAANKVTVIHSPTLADVTITNPAAFAPGSDAEWIHA